MRFLFKVTHKLVVMDALTFLRLCHMIGDDNFVVNRRLCNAERLTYVFEQFVANSVLLVLYDIMIVMYLLKYDVERFRHTSHDTNRIHEDFMRIDDNLFLLCYGRDNVQTGKQLCPPLIPVRRN